MALIAILFFMPFGFGRRGGGEGEPPDNIRPEDIVGEVRKKTPEIELFTRLRIQPGTFVESEHPNILKGRKSTWQVTDIDLDKTWGPRAHIKSATTADVGFFNAPVFLEGYIRIAGQKSLTDFWKNPTPDETKKVFEALGWKLGAQLAFPKRPYKRPQPSVTIVGFDIFDGTGYEFLKGDPAVLIRYASDPKDTPISTPITGLLAIGAHVK